MFLGFLVNTNITIKTYLHNIKVQYIDSCYVKRCGKAFVENIYGFKTLKMDIKSCPK